MDLSLKSHLVLKLAPDETVTALLAVQATKTDRPADSQQREPAKSTASVIGR
jgi:hypothetical protein